MVKFQMSYTHCQISWPVWLKPRGLGLQARVKTCKLLRIYNSYLKALLHVPCYRKYIAAQMAQVFVDYQADMKAKLDFEENCHFTFQ